MKHHYHSSVCIWCDGLWWWCTCFRYFILILVIFCRCNQHLVSVVVVYVHFLTLATILWVHLITEMRSNRLHRNVIFLLNILYLISFIFLCEMYMFSTNRTEIEEKRMPYKFINSWSRHTHARIKISHNQCHLSSSTPWLRHSDKKFFFSTWYVLYHVSIFLVCCFHFLCGDTNTSASFGLFCFVWKIASIANIAYVQFGGFKYGSRKCFSIFYYGPRIDRFFKSNFWFGKIYMTCLVVSFQSYFHACVRVCTRSNTNIALNRIQYECSFCCYCCCASSDGVNSELNILERLKCVCSWWFALLFIQKSQSQWSKWFFYWQSFAITRLK